MDLLTCIDTPRADALSTSADLFLQWILINFRVDFVMILNRLTPWQLLT
jgi:hypothetical protein